MRRDALYPCGYDRGRASIGMPKAQPKARNPYIEELKAQALCAVIVLVILAGIFLAGRGGN